MKLATYNIENIWSRCHHLHRLEYELYISEFEHILGKLYRTGADYARLRQLFPILGLNYNEKLFLQVCQANGPILPKTWVEWNYLPLNGARYDGEYMIIKQPIGSWSRKHKQQVLDDVNADVVLVQEVEDRQSLTSLSHLGKFIPENLMMMPGNHAFEREMLLCYPSNFVLSYMLSSVNLRDKNSAAFFGYDFQIYELVTAKGNSLWLLCVHLEEGNKTRNDLKRKLQAQYIARAYQDLRRKGKQHIAVMGTFGAVSFCHSLKPLLYDCDLKDVSRHPLFRNGSSSGNTYHKRLNIRNKDYLLLSPKLYDSLKACGIHRWGMWAGESDKWPVYPRLIKEEHAASSHPLIWVELDL